MSATSEQGGDDATPNDEDGIDEVDHLRDSWVVFDLVNDNQREADSRGGAENMVETIEDLANDGEEIDVEVYAPGEAVPTTVEQARALRDGDAEAPTDDQPDAPKQESDSDAESASESDAPEVIDDTDGEDAPAPVDDAQTAADMMDTDALAPSNIGIAQDPLDVLPGWMTTQVDYSGKGDSSTTVNKRGCQVIAEYLKLDVESVTDEVVKAHETDFEYAHYAIRAVKPDGRSFTAHGTARADPADQGEDAGWKLDMMAETRAYKRAVKMATGGGVEAFAKEQEGGR